MGVFVCQDPDYIATLRLAFVLTMVALTSLRPTKPHLYTCSLGLGMRKHPQQAVFAAVCMCVS